MFDVPLSPAICARLIEEIDKALERKTPTGTPMFVMQDQLRDWLDSWRHERELLLVARRLLHETMLRLRAAGDP